MNWRPFVRDRSGATAIEFAIVLLPLVLLFFGTFEFARALQTNNNLSFAAGKASRAILLDNNIPDEDLSEHIRETFIGGDADRLQITHGSETVDGAPFRTVTLSYPFDFVVDAILREPIMMSVFRRVPTQ